jgi:hypothetical protein
MSWVRAGMDRDVLLSPSRRNKKAFKIVLDEHDFERFFVPPGNSSAIFLFGDAEVYL